MIVTYNWPPRNAIGTHRPYSWAKCWSEAGAKITVLTAVKHKFDGPLDLDLPLLSGVDVIEIPYTSPIASTIDSLRIGKGVSTLFKILKRIKKSLMKYLGVSMDIRGGWADSARPFAIRLAKDVDVVVSTYGPAAAHFIASELKQANPKIRWVADYRDMWSQSHLPDLPLWAKRLEQNRELKIVASRADRVTTVSQELADELSSFLGRDVDCVMNGFDITESELRSNLSRKHFTGANRPLRIVYTGMIYPGRRDPTPLFEAIAMLAKSGVVGHGDLMVEFYGDKSEGLKRIIAETSMSPFVTLAGHVSRPKALLAQSTANFVLLLESGLADAKGVLTGKLFEYLGAGVPILSLGSKRDSAIGRVLEECGSGACLENDVEKIAEILQDALNGKTPTWFNPDIDRIIQFSRRNQAMSMCQHIVCDYLKFPTNGFVNSSLLGESEVECRDEKLHGGEKTIVMAEDNESQ